VWNVGAHADAGAACVKRFWIAGSPIRMLPSFVILVYPHRRQEITLRRAASSVRHNAFKLGLRVRAGGHSTSRLLRKFLIHPGRTTS
jgi:hypothetical protein